jgi:hypothetical protein
MTVCLTSVCASFLFFFVGISSQRGSRRVACHDLGFRTAELVKAMLHTAQGVKLDSGVCCEGLARTTSTKIRASCQQTPQSLCSSSKYQVTERHRGLLLELVHSG